MMASPASVLHDAPYGSIDARSRRNADPASALFRKGYGAPEPDMSSGFADVDAAATAAIVVSDSGTNDVYAFSTKGKLVAKITGFSEPEGMAATKAGSFYVANTVASNVLLYENDYKTKIATLSDPSEYPIDVSYEATTGIVGVANVSMSGGTGSVSFYAKGKTTPCVTVGNPAWESVYFDAFDSRGDLFVDGVGTSGKALVGEVVGGCQAKTIATLNVGSAILDPGGIQVTKADDIAILDGASIRTYKPPVKGSLGTPIATTELNGASSPVSFAFTSTGKDLWTADAGLPGSEEYAYPAGGSPIATITGSGLTEPIGIVVTPIEVP
jgi:hypothetical protein